MDPAEGAPVERRLEIVLRQLALALPDDPGRIVQPLAQHAEVIYEDEPGFDPSIPAHLALGMDAEEEGAVAVAIPTRIHVDASTPFWVRHTDFSMQLTAELDVLAEGPRTRITGPVIVRRGFLSLLGKSFEVRESTIRFAGGATVDPTLDITAVHDLPSGHDVTVRIGGHLLEPTLAFSSSDPSAETDTDVIALLAGVRGAAGEQQEERAEEQATAMVAGLTAGLVGTLARRELGEWVPVLGLDTAGTLESTRVRAGMQADRVIPEAWRSVVQGAYVEGSVAGDEQAGARAGFLIELFFPHHLTSSATFEQPDNWSLDLLWEP